MINLSFMIVILASIAPGSASITLKLNKHRPNISSVVLSPSRRSHSYIRAQKTDEVPLDVASSRGLAYTVDIEVGGTNFPVVVDTGSWITWVPSNSCKECTTMVKSNLEPPQNCAKASLQYDILTGAMEGCYINSSLKIGDLAVQNYELLVATSIDGIMVSGMDYMSGILGIGSETGQSNGDLTVISALFASGQIMSPTVGFYLARDDEAKTESEMTIGNVSSSSHVDVTKSVKLPRTGNKPYYQVTMDALKIGDSTIIGKATAVFDTGSTDFVVPTAYASAIHTALLGGSRYWTWKEPGSTQILYVVPCGADLQRTTLVFGGTEWTIDNRDLIGPEMAPGWCVSRIMPYDLDFWLLGDAFLTNVYSAYNVQTGEVTLYGVKR